MLSPKQTYIYGKQPILEAFDASESLEKIIISKGLTDADFIQRIKIYCNQKAIPYQFIPYDGFKRILTTYTRKPVNHQGVMALKPMVEYYFAEEVLQLIYDKGELPLLVAFDGITDIRNVGAIARSALNFDAQAIIYEKKGNATINADAIKSSAGALSKIMVCREHSLEQTLKHFALNGVQIIGLAMGSEQTIEQVDFKVPTVIVVGSEFEGISPLVQPLLTQTCGIKTSGKIDSLNASVALGITLNEAFNQRITN